MWILGYKALALAFSLHQPSFIYAYEECNEKMIAHGLKAGFAIVVLYLYVCVR